MSDVSKIEHACKTCGSDTLHRYRQTVGVRSALHAVKVLVFAVSAGFAYPNVVTGDEASGECERCKNVVMVP